MLGSVLKQCGKDGWTGIQNIRKDYPLDSREDLEEIVRIISATARPPKSKPIRSTALEKLSVKRERRVGTTTTKKLPVKALPQTAVTKVTGTKEKNTANARKKTKPLQKDENPTVSICPTQNRYEQFQTKRIISFF